MKIDVIFVFCVYLRTNSTCLSPHSISWLVIITATKSVYCSLLTLYIQFRSSLVFTGLISTIILCRETASVLHIEAVNISLHSSFIVTLSVSACCFNCTGEEKTESRTNMIQRSDMNSTQFCKPPTNSSTCQLCEG